MKVIISILMLNLLQTIPVLSTEDYVSETDLKSFIDFIKARVDLTANPCTDFAKYACHNVPHDVRNSKYAAQNIHSYIPSILVEAEPHNQGEIKVRDFYLSCLKEYHDTGNDTSKRIQHIFAQITDLKFVTEDDQITGKDISNMLFKFYHLDSEGIPIHFHVPHNYEEDEFHKLRITFRRNIKYDTRIKEILTAVNFANGIDEIVELDKEIVDISRKILEDSPGEHSYTDLSTKSVKELEEFLQLNNINLKDFYDNFHTEYKIKIVEIDFDMIGTKEILKAIDSTNKHTIMNYLTYNYIKALLANDCHNEDIINNFYSLAVKGRIWDNVFQSKSLERINEVLNQFQNHINGLENKIKPNFLLYLAKINNNINYYRKHMMLWNDLMPVELRERYYNKYQTDRNQFYSNILQVYKYYVSKSFKINLSKEDNSKIEYFEEFFEIDFQETLRDRRPYIEFYSTLYNNLWYSIFAIEFDAERASDLLSQPNKDERLNLVQTIREYPRQLIALNHVLNISKDHNSGLYKEKELINTKYSDNGVWNLEKLYFIAFAQYKCEEPETEISNSKYVFQTIQNLNEFSKAFNCTVNPTSPEYLVKAEERCKAITQDHPDILPLCSKSSFDGLFA